LRKYAVHQLNVERSVGVRSPSNIVSERNVELMLERKVVNCVGLKLAKSVRAKCSVEPEREHS
jgi:hypothetical protein